MRKFFALIFIMSFILYAGDKQKNGTSVAAVDTLICGFQTTGWSITNEGAPSDTMYVCETANFAASRTIIILGQETHTFPFHWYRIYYKFGATPTSGIAYRIRVF